MAMLRAPLHTAGQGAGAVVRARVQSGELQRGGDTRSDNSPRPTPVRRPKTSRFSRGVR